MIVSLFFAPVFSLGFKNGFSSGGATAEDISLLKAHIGPKVGIKASGGIRTLEDADRLMKLGASRLGASSLVKLARQQLGQA